MSLKYLVTCFCLVLSVSAWGEIWAFSQEFVRFGKKDVYEELKKQWNQEYINYFKKDEFYPILAIEDLDAPEYTYLTPVVTYSGLDLFESVKKDKKADFSSTLNFCVESLGAYLASCSYIPEFMNASFCNMPYVHYQIFSLKPGNGEVFEAHLEKMVFEEQMKKSNLCWRVWKVTFGGDVPKYIVCRFAQSKESLGNDEIYFIHENLKEILRRHREGKGILRRDLSIVIPRNT